MGQHVLVPVDGSDESKQALEHVIAELSDAEITLLHVVNPVSAVSYGTDEYFDAEGYQKQLEHQRERGETLLKEFREFAVERGLEGEIETVLETGQPAREILRTVEERGVDQIVMGSRGRSGVGRVLFGSVAETVTRRASVPVTIVR